MPFYYSPPGYKCGCGEDANIVKNVVKMVEFFCDRCLPTNPEPEIRTIRWLGKCPPFENITPAQYLSLDENTVIKGPPRYRLSPDFKTIMRLEVESAGPVQLKTPEGYRTFSFTVETPRKVFAFETPRSVSIVEFIEK